MPHPLPIDSVLPAIADALERSRSVVIAAPPGAGKTTRVPPALLDASWATGKRILMLEPRRLAARRAAEYMAKERNEPVGRTVGYRIRGETRVGGETRIEVVTEGILTRMLLSQLDLPGIAAVVFDEFHERSIHADLGLSLTLDLQRHLRSDLRIVVMSATLDTDAVANILGGSPVVRSEGRVHPVETHYATAVEQAPVEQRTAETVRRALRATEGDLLVFLPGVREIRRTEERLLERPLPDDPVVHMLYGDAPSQAQQQALGPDPSGHRKVILSTSIAETSLTIDGVRVVIDAGLARSSRFDPRRGMSALVTGPVSKASAEQRRGRAGRQAPGWCFRLWRENDHVSLPDAPLPEIVSTDLAGVALDLAVWGDPMGDQLRFLDPPARPLLEQARGLLHHLDAIDRDGRLTDHGRAMALLPVHPRLAHMIIRSSELRLGALACDVAALLEERDLFTGRGDLNIDLGTRLEAFSAAGRRSGGRSDVPRWAVERIRATSERLQALVTMANDRQDTSRAGLVLGFAYPDRVGRRRGSTETYQLAGGQAAALPRQSMLGRNEYLAVGDVEASGPAGRIRLAAPLDPGDVLQIAGDALDERSEVSWDAVSESVIARTSLRFGSLIIEERPYGGEQADIVAAMTAGVRTMGIECLPWTKEARSFTERAEWVRAHARPPGRWPDCSVSALEASLGEWLQPFLGGITRRSHLSRLDLMMILRSRFSHEQLRFLDRFAPPHLTVPSGSRIRIDYGASGDPVLAVKLQELFGLTDTPTVGNGSTPLTIHLLSPAARPLAVTQDLPSFWTNVYPEIRAQLRSRYPRHPWPEDPLSAAPTRKTVRRRRT